VQFACGLFIIAMLAIGIFWITRPASPPILNSKAYGCYITANAPPILLDAHGMAIGQTTPLHMGFHLQQGNLGIALATETAIAEPIPQPVKTTRYHNTSRKTPGNA
jgi:hypothetical protein